MHLARERQGRGPWIFGREVLRPRVDIEAGALVEVRDPGDRFLGHALYNPASDIRLRMLTHGRRTEMDRPSEFLRRTLASADRLRRKTLRLTEVTDAYRMCHAEGDDLPGLVVDRFADVIVCEHHSYGFWRIRDEVEKVLLELHPGGRIAHRVPKTACKSEGFEPEQGEVEPLAVEIKEHGIRYPLLAGAGHKTGFFCDQRDNRARLARISEGRVVLDLCCNLGGFALQAARGGARAVHAVDLDEVALARAEEAGRLNGLEVDWIHDDAYRCLRGLKEAGHRPEVMVVDPHKLIPGKREIERGLVKYLDLNTLAFEVIRPGGLMMTFSCSGALEDSAFVGMLFRAARRAERSIRLLEKLGAGPDHPQRPDFSRSRYLKGALIAVD